MTWNNVTKGDFPYTPFLGWGWFWSLSDNVSAFLCLLFAFILQIEQSSEVIVLFSSEAFFPV